MRRVAWLALLALALPAQAQFGGIDIGKALDIGKRVVKGTEASRELTQEQEIALGEAATASFLGASPLHRDENLQRYVNRVGRWLALHSERPDLPWSFGVLDTETINAFALPGGSIVVSNGLMKRLASESELAGVLAHEIAHVVKRHQVMALQSSASGSFWASLGKDVASEAISRRGGGALAQQARSWASGVVVDLIKDGFFLRPLDRSMEHEADQLAIVIATRSGYDPYGLVAALQMLAQYRGDADAASVFSTHPPAAERMAELERFLPTVERYAGNPRLEGRYREVVGPR
ncbi:MAG TPA: M48 family metalloprotease [Usitatibacter sp.]|nr:M48 family metalloprotease [Usitatibacter sp.]